MAFRNERVVMLLALPGHKFPVGRSHAVPLFKKLKIQIENARSVAIFIMWLYGFIVYFEDVIDYVKKTN